MSDALILLLGDSPGAPLRWGRVTAGRLVEGGRLADAGELGALRDHAGEAETVAALLPGEQVAMRRLPAPPRSEAKFRAAAAYLLEDELGEPTNELQVAIGAAADEGLAVAVKRRIIEDWLFEFRSAEIRCTLMTADFLALSPGPSQGTVIFEAARVVVAAPAGGFAVEHELFPAVSGAVFAAPPETLSVFGDNARQSLLPPVAHVEWMGPAEDATLLVHYAARLAAAPPLNLLQGAYRRRRAWRASLEPWRRTGALAAACVGLLAVLAVADGLRAERMAQRWREASLAIHREAFPDAANEDPARHARRVLSQGGERSFLTLSTRFAEAAEAAGSVQIDRVSYDAERGGFIVSVRSRSDADIEALKDRLAEGGVAARDNGGYRRTGAYWTGELAAGETP